jgi:PAS domain S-box-containing protein
MASRSSADVYAETLAVFDRSEHRHEPLTTPEVAEALGANRRTVYKRLRKLAEQGRLETKTTGANSRIWWRPITATADGDHTAEKHTPATSQSGTKANPGDPPPSATEESEQASPSNGARDDSVRTLDDTDSRDQRDDESTYQIERILDTVEAAIFLKDTNGRYLLMNQNFRDLIGIDDETDVVGMTDSDLFPKGFALGYTEMDKLAIETKETVEVEEKVPAPEGVKTVLTRKTPLFDDDGDPYAVCGVATDITARKEREQELRSTRRFNEELVENAPFAMFRLDEQLRITYENPRAEEIIGLPDEKDASVAIGTDIRDVSSISETGQADLFTRLKDGETIEFEFPFESIYDKEAYFAGRGVPLYRDGEFDGAVLMANDISERRRREEELERQREQLAALNEINDVVREIIDAVIAQSTRAEIEQVVCDRLAQTDSYRFACRFTIDSDLQIESRVAAGTDDIDDEISVGTDADEQSVRGLVKRVARTQEVAVTQQVYDGPNATDQSDAAESELQSAAAIPIAHQGMLYGVLAVLSERPGAFTTEERAVVRQLGEVVGQAITAVDRKRALMSDEVIEVEIRIPQLLASQVVSVNTDETVTVERWVPLGNDEYLLYGTTTAEGIELMRALGEQLSDWNNLHIIDDKNETVRFEQQLSNPPITSTIVDHGGAHVTGQIADGEYRARLHVPP